jgi:hypothetical protein
MEKTLKNLVMAALFGAATLATSNEARAQSDNGLRFELPIACNLGETCFVQNYVDRDASAEVTDYTCGSASYNGHTGTDFRTRTITETVDVIAAADGKVLALRDTVPDNLMRTETERAAVEKIECGNGVLIQHKGGLVTQYCHMKRGSLAVKQGDAVKTGQRLGMVGYSGMTEFPHVHFEIRKEKTVFDPFDARPAPVCGGDAKPLWSAAALKKIKYGSRQLLSLSWNSGPIELTDLVEGKVAAPALNPDVAAIVAYAWLINLRAEDVITIVLAGPEGIIAENSMLVQQNSSERVIFAGGKRPEAGWPTGQYKSKVTIKNKGTVHLDETRSKTIP